MSNKWFSDEVVKSLSNNQYIKSVSKKSLSFTNDFKRLFIIEREKGKFPRQIFDECGLDEEIIGESRIRNSARRWWNAYINHGVSGLEENRKGVCGRPRVH